MGGRSWSFDNEPFEGRKWKGKKEKRKVIGCREEKGFAEVKARQRHKKQRVIT